MSEFTHFNEQGRARMVDVSDKPVTSRSALAGSSIRVPEDVYLAVTQGDIKKGDVLAVAQIAGITGAKQTSTLIPMCHPLPLSNVDISFYWKTEEAYELFIEAFVKTKGSTGVEMEALTAASAAALTVYDMCKALDKGMVIGPTYLLEKTGGKSGDYYRETHD
ncbi:cyclic pyranopterin monophosphate synthase MoaC [Marinococcus halophilus]|uniref:Cyclic pyranopterin monophosphate synthase n=1 Tax=Marinococcus halophilus TaxID=1371 RepID=A0A510Y2R7_MARHA|nr:cyclic pyranopterin monophosphate synthase MoaC [Marinococcus halophilus]OZT81639.1 cyclic pyranopterin monophosphate synthase MoaC [Marinococcus halophilus]GEK57589.1 cyclic pyranopterin monophosphate synthase accessory protein [Marinococcus halophilus]